MGSGRIREHHDRSATDRTSFDIGQSNSRIAIVKCAARSSLAMAVFRQVFSRRLVVRTLMRSSAYTTLGFLAASALAALAAGSVADAKAANDKADWIYSRSLQK